MEGEIETALTPDLTIVAMMSGTQTIEVRKRGRWHSASYAPGTVGLTPAGQSNIMRRHSLSAVAPEKVVLYLPSRHLEEAADHYRRAGAFGRREELNALAFNDRTLVAMSVALLRAVRSRAPNLYAETAAQWIAVHLLATHAGWRSISDDGRSSGEISDRRLRRVLEFMAVHLAAPLTLAKLASEAGVSKFHFSRLFCAKIGMTPMGYLRTLRLDHARTLLLSSDLSVSEVARHCGYDSPTHFTTAFGRRFGYRPSETRRQNMR